MVDNKAINRRIASNLSRIRQTHKNPDTGRPYSQYDIASRIGIGRSTYNHYELGDYETISLTTIVNFCKFFKIDIVEIVGDIHSDEIEDKRMDSINKFFEDNDFIKSEKFEGQWSKGDLIVDIDIPLDYYNVVIQYEQNSTFEFESDRDQDILNFLDFTLSLV